MATNINIWKPIVAANGVLEKAREEGLVGIEECVNYNVNTITSYIKDTHKRSNTEILNKNKRGKHSNLSNHKQKGNATDLLCPSRFGSTTEALKISKEEMEDVDLIAWNNFGLPKTILKTLQELNFEQPTPIQALTLPAAILGRRDILGASETGSGKTLAFGLPILVGILELKKKSERKTKLLGDTSEENNNQNLSKESNSFKKDAKVVVGKPLYALILTPTRELAIQIKDHLDAVAKYTGIKTAVIVGGMASVKQERLLSQGPEIVVATPGRLWELIQQGNAHLSQLDTIRYLVIDETDRMLERGHFQELHDLLEQINCDMTKKEQRQNFVFSATLTLVHDLPDYLKRKAKRAAKIEEMTSAQKLKKIINMLDITNAKVVDITQGTGTSSTLTECKISCDTSEKDYYVYYFLKKHPGKTLIFCNTIGCVRRLSTLLNLLGCHPLPLHASMQQRQRLKSLEKFKEFDNSVLIATDVAARGLDIPFVEHVLHYQTPRTSESYVHRSGRTARATQQGITILLIGPDEIQNYLKICTTLGKSKDLPVFPVEQNYLAAVKHRVNLAREIDNLQLQVRKTNSEDGWFKKVAKDMDIIIDVKKKYDVDEAKQWKNIADAKRKQLAKLVETPIFRVGLSKGVSLNMNNLSMFIEEPSNETSAIDILKKTEELNFKQKKKIPSLYKNKIKKKVSSHKKDYIGNIKFVKTVKSNKANERKKRGMK